MNKQVLNINSVVYSFYVHALQAKSLHDKLIEPLEFLLTNIFYNGLLVPLKLTISFTNIFIILMTKIIVFFWS